MRGTGGRLSLDEVERELLRRGVDPGDQCDLLDEYEALIEEAASNSNGQPAPEPEEEVIPTPWDYDAEEDVLAAIIQSPAALDRVLAETGLEPEHFYKRADALIFEAARELRVAGHEPDATMLIRALRERGSLDEAGGRDRLKILASLPVAPVNAHKHARALVRV